jgi:hypothetical protein
MSSEELAQPTVAIDAVVVYHTDPSHNPPIITRYMLAPVDAKDACERFPDAYSMTPPPASVDIADAAQPPSPAPAATPAPGKRAAAANAGE